MTGSSSDREPGFWSSLFGAEPEYHHDTTVYDRSLAAAARSSPSAPARRI